MTRQANRPPRKEYPDDAVLPSWDDWLTKPATPEPVRPAAALSTDEENSRLVGLPTIVGAVVSADWLRTTHARIVWQIGGEPVEQLSGQYRVTADRYESGEFGPARTIVVRPA